MIDGTIKCENGRLVIDLDMKALCGMEQPGELRIEAEPGDFRAMRAPGECAAKLKIMLCWPHEFEE